MFITLRREKVNMALWKFEISESEYPKSNTTSFQEISARYILSTFEDAGVVGVCLLPLLLLPGDRLPLHSFSVCLYQSLPMSNDHSNFK